MSNNHDRKSVPEENFSQQFDLANFLTAVESTSTKSLTSVEFFNSFSSKKNTPGFKESITETIQSSKVYNGNEADITHVYDAILASLGKPEQLFQQLLTKVNFTVDEALTLMSKIYPQNIDKVELFDDIFSAIQKYEKEIDLQPLKKAFRRGSPFYGPLFQAKLHEKFGLAIDLNIVGTIIIPHYETPLKLIEKLKEAKIELSGLTDYIYPQHKSIKTILLNLPTQGIDEIRNVATNNSLSRGTTQFQGNVSTIQMALEHVLGVDVQLTFDMMKDDISGILTYLHTIYNDSGFKNPFHTALPFFQSDKANSFPPSTTDINEHPADKLLAQIDSFLGQQPMYISKLPQPIALTGRSAGDRSQGEYSLRIPQPRFFTPLQKTEMFFTPQQSILYFGTLSETIIALRTKPLLETPTMPNSSSTYHNPPISTSNNNSNNNRRRLNSAVIVKLLQPLLRKPTDLSTYTNLIILHQIRQHQALLLKFNALEQSSHVEQLAKELQMDKITLIDILVTCSTLMFRFHTPGLSEGPNVVVAPHGEGKSTLYLLLLNTLNHLNIPVGYMASEWVVEPQSYTAHNNQIGVSSFPTDVSESTTDNNPREISSSALPASDLSAPSDPNRYIGFHSDGSTGFELFESDSPLPPQSCSMNRGLVFFTDCPDKHYTFENWDAYRKPYINVLHPVSLAFTFSSAGKRLSTSWDKTQTYILAQYGIYPFLFTPTITNYLKGTIQLQFYRQFASLLRHPLTIASLLQSSTPSQNEQELSEYFSDKLYQLVTKYQNDFIQQCISPSNITNQLVSSFSQLSIENGTTTTITTTTTTPSLQPNTSSTTSLPIKLNNDYQLLTQFINDSQHYPLYSEIVTNPVLKALTYKHMALFADYNTSPKTDTFSLFLSSLQDPQDPHRLPQQQTSSLTGPKQTQFKNNAVSIPSALLVTKDGPTSATVVDPDAVHISYDAIIPKQHKWYGFHQSLQSTTATLPTTTPSSLNLFNTIHQLWYDLSLLHTHLIPNTRHFSFLTRDTGTDSIRFAYPAESLLPTYEPASNKKNEQPTLKLTVIPPKVASFFTEFKHINILQYYHHYIYPTGSDTTKPTQIYNKSSIGFELYFIDSLSQWIDKHAVHLPFNGFHFNPIENIRSYNNFHGIQPQATPQSHFTFITLQDATRRGFLADLSSFVATKKPSSTLVVCPGAFPCVDFIYVQRHNDKTQLLCLQLSAGVQQDKHKNDILSDLLDDTKFSVSDVAYTYITNQFLPILPQMDLPFYAINKGPQFISQSELSSMGTQTQSGIIYLKQDNILLQNSQLDQIQVFSLDSINKAGKNPTTKTTFQRNVDLFASSALQSLHHQPHHITFRLTANPSAPRDDIIINDQINDKFPRIKKKIDEFRHPGKKTVFDITTNGSKDGNGCYSYKIDFRHPHPDSTGPQPWDWNDAFRSDGP